MMPYAFYIEWCENNLSEDDCVPGVFFNAQNKQWVVHDIDALKDYIANGD